MTAPISPANKFIVCHECDLICIDAALSTGEAASCPRCQATLYRNGRASLDLALAVAITSVILLLILNSFPLLTLKVQQVSRDTTLFNAALAMWDDGMHIISMLVILTTMLVPALQISVALYILCLLKFGDASRALGAPLRFLQTLRPWSMVEVFMLGLLVSLVKLQNMADIVIGPALWACACIIFVTAALTSILTPRNVWLWAHPASQEMNAGVKHV
ncbi:paraquat-inducible protein A [Undibacterium sp. TJN19]|uniref:paraquat-inducible protein A n=1 Tax=Undibacterium sp. TJN19 TaxID=3413055 RepID=UPI003BF1C684